MDKDTQITQHFKYGEFWCKDGTEPPEEYLDNIYLVATELEKLRAVLNRPIYITSAYRTKKYNAAHGGAKNSQHLYAKAADIKVSGVHSRQVCMYVARYTNFMGIGINCRTNNFTHCDIRDKFTLFYY